MNRFIAIDRSETMLKTHPTASFIDCIVSDFNEENWLNQVSGIKFDRIISSSSLQWSNNMDDVFFDIKKTGSPISLSIFTSGTFKTLHETANIPPLLKSKEEISGLIKKHFKSSETELVTYKLYFENTSDIFKYIKRSGVSGSRNLLSYQQMKNLILNYPFNWLEFEIVFVHEH
jgi:malonyl-CoA O-methyltransferase